MQFQSFEIELIFHWFISHKRTEKSSFLHTKTFFGLDAPTNTIQNCFCFFHAVTSKDFNEEKRYEVEISFHSFTLKVVQVHL